jgi:signal transduction histidine kinase
MAVHRTRPPGACITARHAADPQFELAAHRSQTWTGSVVTREESSMNGTSTPLACGPADCLRFAVAGRAHALDVAQLVHDLRTPLNGILGIVQLLTADAQDPLPPRHLRRLAVLRDAGDDMLAIGEDVLDAARDAHQRRPLQTGPIDLVAEVRGALALIRAPRARASRWNACCPTRCRRPGRPARSAAWC